MIPILELADKDFKIIKVSNLTIAIDYLYPLEWLKF